MMTDCFGSDTEVDLLFANFCFGRFSDDAGKIKVNLLRYSIVHCCAIRFMVQAARITVTCIHHAAICVITGRYVLGCGTVTRYRSAWASYQADPQMLEELFEFRHGSYKD